MASVARAIDSRRRSGAVKASIDGSGGDFSTMDAVDGEPNVLDPPSCFSASSNPMSTPDRLCGLSGFAFGFSGLVLEAISDMTSCRSAMASARERLLGDIQLKEASWSNDLPAPHLCGEVYALEGSVPDSTAIVIVASCIIRIASLSELG
eukprot:scaffold54920_cov33-Tisochrysis_lutea.AAC.3